MVTTKRIPITRRPGPLEKDRVRYSDSGFWDGELPAPKQHPGSEPRSPRNRSKTPGKNLSHHLRNVTSPWKSFSVARSVLITGYEEDADGPPTVFDDLNQQARVRCLETRIVSCEFDVYRPDSLNPCDDGSCTHDSAARLSRLATRRTD